MARSRYVDRGYRPDDPAAFADGRAGLAQNRHLAKRLRAARRSSRYATESRFARRSFGQG
jgi:hypothetical protein